MKLYKSNIDPINDYRQRTINNSQKSLDKISNNNNLSSSLWSNSNLTYNTGLSRSFNDSISGSGGSGSGSGSGSVRFSGTRNISRSAS